MTLSAGNIIADRYRIERVLGRGGMGVVYVATDRTLERRVALKVLQTTLEDRDDARARFRREAVAASRVRHPNVIEVYDADVASGTPWIAMELLEGESLDVLLDRRGTIEPEEAVWVAAQVLAALEEVHAEGILHRDLKPANLFLERRRSETRLKLLDFGIARGVDGRLPTITRAGQSLGTPWYMPPEQLLGRDPLDARVDLFALGVILFELLTGTWPWDGDRAEQVVARILSADAPPVRSLRPDIPPALAVLVDRACARDRDDRYGAAHEMRAALAASGIEPRGLVAAPPSRDASPAPDDTQRGAGPNAPLEAPAPVVRTTVPLSRSLDRAGAKERPAFALMALAAAVGAGATFALASAILPDDPPSGDAGRALDAGAAVVSPDPHERLRSRRSARVTDPARPSERGDRCGGRRLPAVP